MNESVTLRELMNMVPDTSRMKLPTAKALHEDGTAVLFDFKVVETRLTVYANGFFAYEVESRCTVQSVHRCREAVRYEYADGSGSVCGVEIFLDRPFRIRLMLEGEMRLEANQIARQSTHCYSYDNLFAESVDLVDPNLLEDDVVTRMELEKLRAMLNGLTDKQRYAIEMCAIQGMTQVEAAKRLGISREAVKARLKGAKEALKKSGKETIGDYQFPHQSFVI